MVFLGDGLAYLRLLDVLVKDERSVGQLWACAHLLSWYLISAQMRLSSLFNKSLGWCHRVTIDFGLHLVNNSHHLCLPFSNVVILALTLGQLLLKENLVLLLYFNQLFHCVEDFLLLLMDFVESLIHILFHEIYLTLLFNWLFSYFS